jgi:hypothetical protein
MRLVLRLAIGTASNRRDKQHDTDRHSDPSHTAAYAETNRVLAASLIVREQGAQSALFENPPTIRAPNSGQADRKRHRFHITSRRARRCHRG